ncbi:protein ecdysoneless [Colletotrichum spaethianum]|uniref:Protein ecdysoneless n=1 Tax=Colletotrichum spaethianum TaxID=700344 RepID=A0AA37PA07_9PEZI|nr:protein ecdysoneless [Colletotrichum spaethianum]GKT48413.1 protein ecdysoneless [Colletotrichum spaethianum]
MAQPMLGRQMGTASDDSNVNNAQSLPENCVQYCIFLIDSDAQNNQKKHLSRLEDLRKSALRLTTRLTADYIWQKGSLTLDVVTDQGLTFLRGTTDYGDAIEDEWLIVYILRELSKSHPSAWVRVFDADGEFLLIEAANVLPKWLSPETDQNRVWINHGRLRIIPQQSDKGSKSKLLTLPDAVGIIRNAPGSLIHSDFIEAEAFYRLEKYPGQIQNSLHHALVTIPRRLAHVLHQSPKAVAPAVESFYLRDALDLKTLLSRNNDLHFPPKDLVTLSVKFTRVLFAQLRSQRFEPPVPWATLIQQAKGTEQTRLEMGMKLTCGFEIMLNNISKTDSREAQEASIVAEDLKEDGDSVLPGDDEIITWKDAHREDDESWMDINYEDFENELSGRKGGNRSGPKSGESVVAPNKSAQTGLDENTDEKESDDEELRKLASQLEAELKQHGALKLDQPRNNASVLKDKGKGRQKASVDERNMAATTDHVNTEYEDENDGDDGEVDIDYNLAKNLLESFKGQAGMPGPTGNILGMMGLQLPRDEDTSDVEESKGR